MVDKDLDALLNVILIHVAPAPARQMLCEIERSRVALSNDGLRTTMRRLVERLDERPTQANQFAIDSKGN